MARPCNVSRKDELQALVDATRARWGRIDIVVCNAAANPYFGPLTAIPDEAFDKILTNNVKSVLWLAAMTLEGMAQAGGGSFIVVGSIGGLVANTVIGAYGISKAADHHLVRNLAAEWGPKNVRVNAIAPGLVRTEFARALWEDPQRAAERIAATPLRRLGEPRDIGGIAVFLASEAAAFVTGTMHRRRRRRYHPLAPWISITPQRKRLSARKHAPGSTPTCPRTSKTRSPTTRTSQRTTCCAGTRFSRARAGSRPPGRKNGAAPAGTWCSAISSRKSSAMPVRRRSFPSVLRCARRCCCASAPRTRSAVSCRVSTTARISGARAIPSPAREATSRR